MNKEERIRITKVISMTKQVFDTPTAKQLRGEFIKSILAHNPKFDCKLIVQ